MNTAEVAAPRIIDNAVPQHLLHALDACWPDPSWRGWHTYQDGNAIKRATRDAELLPRAAWPVLYAMAAAAAPRDAWFPDWELHGAGLHEIPPGGHLSLHVDSQVMLSTGWRRERSVVLYLDDFTPGDGGQFLLRDAIDSSIDQLRVWPKFNRLIHFDCTDDAWHAVSEVKCNRPRRSICLFFWSRRPASGNRPTALFQSSASRQASV
jgi:hypothetical protein